MMPIETNSSCGKGAAAPYRPNHARPETPLDRVPVALLLSAMLIAGCGGGSDNTPAPIAPVPTPVAVNCYEGSIDNVVGAEDPLLASSWHLKNTGSNQVVSAAYNNAVSGIDANVEGVHRGGKGCTGKGVAVAIVDSGMEMRHEDLLSNVLAGKSWNFSNNSNDPSPALNQSELDHGTGVAGVVAAQGWNGKGSRGVAPNASLLAFSLISDAVPAAGVTENDMTYLSFGAVSLADATRSIASQFGNRADSTAVFNFSAGSDYAAPTAINDLSPMELAPKLGTTKLRGGLGAVYFQSAGNEFVEMAKGILPDGSSMEVDCPSLLMSDIDMLGGELSKPHSMTCGSPNHEPHGKPYFYQVAAAHNTGKASSYSSAGASNWITGLGGESGTAEAGIVTTDNSGCASGFNNTDNKFALLAKVGEILNKLVADLFGSAGSSDTNCNYTGRFNGTSAAAPTVSGVAALMLEANPKLNWLDVGYILAKTARKIDTQIASGDDQVTFLPIGASSPWNIEDPWIVNAAGFNFQNRYGFGLVDANAAVKLAIGYTAPTGRRSAPLVATGSVASSRMFDEVGLNVASVSFAGSGAVSGPIRLDLTVANNTAADLNPGFLQFVIENTVSGTKSIVMPAFTSWYAGGKAFPIQKGGQRQFRFHTNAFYGEPIAGTYKVYVLDFSGLSGLAGKGLSFTPTLTSFSI